jgi:hypothetical protein
MEQHIWATDQRFSQGEGRLAELELLALKRQAWGLAIRQDWGRRLLALTHYIHARYHVMWGNVTGEGQEATKTLEMLPEKEYGGHVALFAAAMAARGATYGGRRAAPQKGIEILRHFLRIKRWPETAAWARSEMASFLCLSGDIEAGLALNEEARQMVAGREVSHRKRRDYSHAYLLFRYAGKPAEALKAAPVVENDTPQFQIEATVLRAEILMALEEFAEAHHCLQVVLRDMETYRMEQFRPRTDALAQRL